MAKRYLEISDHSRALELYGMPVLYKFSKEELSFLIDYINNKKGNYKVKYCFYKGVSRHGCQIEFVIDSMSNSPRKSGVENMWEVFAERDLCDIEIEELAANWGRNKRRFIKWMYKDIDYLIEEDLKYGIQTPEKFVKECIKRGYVSKKSKLISE